MIDSNNRAWSFQDGFDLRFDWGPQGVERLAPLCRTVVIIDVLRFTSAVETACAAGITVYPYRWRDDSAEAFAAARGAVLADSSRQGGPSLSPPSLLKLPAGSRVVLPSPNGATCSILAATTVAQWLEKRERPIGIIACGEVWPDGSIRPSFEDMMGAGAILARISGTDSPEADAAASAFVMCVSRLEDRIRECASARQLLEMGSAGDVEWCLQTDVSEAVPVLRDGAFQAAT